MQFDLLSEVHVVRNRQDLCLPDLRPQALAALGLVSE